MKYPVYIQIGQTKTRKNYIVRASNKPTHVPLSTGQNSWKVFYPTVSFRVDVDVPDEAFKSAENLIAELNISMKAAQINSEIVLPKGIIIKK
jgi:hypothetical protein